VKKDAAAASSAGTRRRAIRVARAIAPIHATQFAARGAKNPFPVEQERQDVAEAADRRVEIGLVEEREEVRQVELAQRLRHPQGREGVAGRVPAGRPRAARAEEQGDEAGREQRPGRDPEKTGPPRRLVHALLLPWRSP
jgi:hypothetical protein